MSPIAVRCCESLICCTLIPVLRGRGICGDPCSVRTNTNDILCKSIIRFCLFFYRRKHYGGCLIRFIASKPSKFRFAKDRLHLRFNRVFF